MILESAHFDAVRYLKKIKELDMKLYELICKSAIFGEDDHYAQFAYGLDWRNELEDSYEEYDYTCFTNHLGGISLIYTEEEVETENEGGDPDFIYYVAVVLDDARIKKINGYLIDAERAGDEEFVKLHNDCFDTLAEAFWKLQDHKSSYSSGFFFDVTWDYTCMVEGKEEPVEKIEGAIYDCPSALPLIFVYNLALFFYLLDSAILFYEKRRDCNA